MTIKPEDIKGRYKLKVDISKSSKIPETPTWVKVTDDAVIFPEDVQIYKHDDEYIYAFGVSHVWRSSDVKRWELVK